MHAALGGVNLGVHHLGVGEDEFTRNEALCIGPENLVPHQIQGQIRTGQGGTQRQQQQGGLDPPGHSGGGKTMPLQIERPDARHGGQGDEHTVDGIQIQRPADKLPLARGDAITGCADWRHQGRGNGHTGNDVGLFPARDADNASEATEQGNQHIPQRGRGTGQQLGLRLLQRCESKIQGRDHQADEGGDAQIGERAFDQIEVVHRHPQTGPHDGPHQGRYEHGTDDDSGGVDVEAHRGHKDGKNQNPRRGPPQIDTFADAVFDFIVIGLVIAQVEAFSGHVAHALGPSGRNGDGLWLEIHRIPFCIGFMGQVCGTDRRPRRG